MYIYIYTDCIYTQLYMHKIVHKHNCIYTQFTYFDMIK